MKYRKKPVVYVCEECNHILTAKEIQDDNASGKWGHTCKSKKYRKECRCESYLQPYTKLEVER